MIAEIRKLKSRSKQQMIYSLQYRHLIETHINDAGYVCYDTDDLKRYKSSVKRGRPPKYTKK